MDRPVLSVVVVTYGGWDWPLRALTALRDRTDPVYEVTVVDNASPDETPRRLREEVRGARLLLNEANVGFGPAANLGAAEARARYLCFLNPDALVGPGWLGPLLDLLENDHTVGAVVPTFLNLDGSLQEAGSVVGSDARTVAYGRDGDPEDPSFRFFRLIDYGSAACLVVRRSAFRRVGGFNPAYLPAYCEDVDLSFALDEAGWSTAYEPRSAVVHAGAGSTDDVVRAELIERNRPVLLERWSERLARRPPAASLDTRPHRLIALRDAATTDRLLILVDEASGAAGTWFAGLAGELAAARRDVRVTLLAPEPDPSLLDRGVEALAWPADLEAWMEDRFLHYSAAVVVGAHAARRADRALRRWQGGALRGYIPAEARGPLDTEPARTADLVLCLTRAVARAVAAAAPGVPVAVVGDGPGASTLEEALSGLGVGPAPDGWGDDSGGDGRPGQAV